ncbi:MAG TPA: lysine--tRNA ligase [Solirubrobacteraceae bacterium]|nr:lysine--tRNA ligase [Solirubrobacteraceae bacterium]
MSPTDEPDAASGPAGEAAPGRPTPEGSGPRHGLDELIGERRAKAQRLRESAREGDFPYSYPGAEPIAAVRAAYEHLAVGEETEDVHRVAGRISGRRGQGRAAFLDLVDRSGKIQLHARLDVLGGEDFERLRSLDLGDLLGVDGAVLRSRHGELTLRVERFAVLGKALRPPPDKHHGLSDVETRHRQRELDLIASEEVRRRFRDRARIIAAVRAQLDGEGFVEVETPVLQPIYGGALARPFTTHHNALDRTLYLRIATELYLKRCIVGGLERVYELGKDFRNEGISTKHNPEFTMVEWYEAYADYNDAAARLEAVVRAAAAAVEGGGEGVDLSGGVRAGARAGAHTRAHTSLKMDLASPWRRLSFVEAIREATGVDVMAHPDAASLAAAIAAAGLPAPGLPAPSSHTSVAPTSVAPHATWPQLADELLSRYVEPTLTEPTFVFDYPVALSPFAREHRSLPGLTERWEAFVGGMEIANAFSELVDPDVQRERFAAQRRLAAQGDEETQPHDELFLTALEHGMPPTAGVGVGIDRLVMALTGQGSIREVVLFPAMR